MLRFYCPYQISTFANMNDIILLTVDFVKHQLKNAEGGHDWFHIERVWKNAEAISKGESCDAEIVALRRCCMISLILNFMEATKQWGPLQRGIGWFQTVTPKRN